MAAISDVDGDGCGDLLLALRLRLDGGYDHRRGATDAGPFSGG
jgi:hypothetical protein